MSQKSTTFNRKSKGREENMSSHDDRSRHKKRPGGKTNGRNIYEEYWSESVVTRELHESSGALFQGRLKINPMRRKIAYVIVEGVEVNIIVDDMLDRNRAHEGYVVAVELYPESEWVPFSRVYADEDETTTPLPVGMQASIASLQLADTGPRKDDMPQHVQGLWRPRDDLLQGFQSGQKPEVARPGPTLTASAAHPLDQISSIGKKQPKGKVVAILERYEHKRIIGAISTRHTAQPGQPLPESESFVTFQPSDGRIPYMIIPRVQLPDAYVQNPFEMGSHIYVADLVQNWPASSKLPFGENLRSIGEVGSIQAETEALLIQNGLNHGLFTDDAIAPLRELLGISSLGSTSGASDAGGWEIPSQEVAQRRDLRSHRIFTIDPSGARDLDDALHITPLFPEEGSVDEVTYEVGVHIADVSYFVTPNSALDNEAKNRATSVYLVQKVIPMLPPILCEQLCSLNPNVDRLAFSVIFRMTADGSLVPGHKPWFGRTIIRSCAKLDYVTAQRMVDGEIPSCPSGNVDNSDSDIDALSDDVWNFSRRPVKVDINDPYRQNAWEIAKDVCMMHSVAMNRRARRLENGALVLNRPKLTFRLDENGNPISTSCYTIRESNQLIEEYMLLANYLVAEKLLETVGPLSSLRAHPPPNMEGLGRLVELAQHLGYALDSRSAMTLQESLKNISQQADSITIRVITSLIMMPMNRAEYFVVGESGPPSWRHYALSIPYYTHFTSPIRRYADVMVHRLLEEGLRAETAAAAAAACQGGNTSTTGNKQINRERFEAAQVVASHCNTQKNAAKAAQERSDVVYLAVYLIKNEKIVDAVVSGIGEKSFTVLVLDYSFESRIFIDKMHNVDSIYDERAKALTLTHRPPTSQSQQNTHDFSRLVVTLMSRLRVRLSANITPPISVRVEIVGDVSRSSMA